MEYQDGQVDSEFLKERDTTVLGNISQTKYLNYQRIVVTTSISM